MNRLFRSILGLAILAGCGFGLVFLFRLLDPAAARQGEMALRLRFSEAGNLTVGAPVRTRGVQIGEIRSIELSPDGTGVLMTASIQPSHVSAVRLGSRFWIVRPRFEGLTRGVDGLDTLLRSPYVVFDTPEGAEPEPVEAGALLIGLAGPPADQGLPVLGAEDLQFTLHFARSFGLEVGAPVLLRDIRVGEVREVELDSGGQWSKVEVAVRGRYRQTVRNRSVFWIQKPTLQSGWLASNIRANELGHLLTGPTVTYFTPEGDSLPLTPGAVLRGQLEPAEIPDSLTGPMVYVPPRNDSEASRLTDAAAKVGEALAGISYTFDELGVFSRTRYAREGTVLLLRGDDGKLRAVTTRGLTDGRYTVSDVFSPADLSAQSWKLRGPGGWLSDGKPMWRADDADLVGLEIQAEIGSRGLSVSDLGAHLDPKAPLQLVAYREHSEPEFVVLPPQTAEAEIRPGVFPLRSERARSLALWEGAVVLDADGKAVGLVGRVKPLSEQPALIGLALLDTKMKGQPESSP